MRRALADDRFDLVLLDLSFPSGEDGISLARGLRMQHDLPIIVLTSKDSTIDKVVCLELGADDYVTKPFEPRELVARIRTVLRRYGRRSEPEHGVQGTAGAWCFAGWRLDPATQTMTSMDGAPVRLTGREFALLEALVSRSGRALSRDQILDIISHRQWSPYDRSIDVLIGKLRRKMRDRSGRGGFIRTVRGVGYMFVLPDEETAETSPGTFGK